MFREVSAIWTGEALDPNIEGGTSSNPQYCGINETRQRDLLDYKDRLFGTRQADYRRWHYDCSSGTTYDIEQYVVASGPGYILFSEHANAQVHDVMTSIANTAAVPAETTPLRYADTGIIRSVAHRADGYHITLDRVVTSGSSPINTNPGTSPYLIPDTVAAQSNLNPAVGSLIYIATDGHHVKQAYLY